MTLRELLYEIWLWANAHVWPLLLTAAVVPLAGTAAARIGKGGRTDEDGKFIASVVLTIALVVGIVAIAATALALGVFAGSLLDVRPLLLAVPLVWVVGSFAGIRLVFPLGELGAVRAARDVLLFAVACGVVVWLFSQFRGWGVVFVGTIAELVIIAALGAFVIRRLFRRAFDR